MVVVGGGGRVVEVGCAVGLEGSFVGGAPVTFFVMTRARPKLLGFDLVGCGFLIFLKGIRPVQ